MGRGDGHLEVEVKYDLGPDGTTPDLGGLVDVKGVAEVRPAGTQRLSAIYYDTPDLILLANRVTLRRRTGGSDAGWHLKLPLADARLEVHRPAGRSGSPVPAELAGLVRSLLRDRAPQPVVRLRTTRVLTQLLDADGRVLAEIADDAVTATVLGQEPSSSWRELEVELVDGPARLLPAVGRQLCRQGAVPAAFASKLARALDGRLPARPVPNGHRGPSRSAGAGAVVLAHLRAQRDQLLGYDPQVRLDSHDAVHQMRVTTRRARSVLAGFRSLFTAEAATGLREELAWLAGVLGAARDAEVLRDLLAAELAALPEDLLHGPVQARITTDLEQAYRAAHAQAVAELDGPRYLALLAALDAFVADPPFARPAHRPADREIPALVERAVRRVTRELAAAVAQADLDQRELLSHEVRKAAKRARYAAETAGSLFGAPARTLVKQMRSVQETLGSHQDSLLARAWLAEAAARAEAAGEPTFSYGLLYARQAHGDGDTDANLATAAELLAAQTGPVSLRPAKSAR
jgi:CHAD domain-containing protein